MKNNLLKHSPLRLARHKKGETLDHACKQLNKKGVRVNVSMLSRIETDQYWPNRKLSKGLINYFNISANDILFPFDKQC